MPVKKTIEAWEQNKGCIVKDANPRKELTEEDFDNIPRSDKHGVNHADRKKFLHDNGYPITRENMIADLSAREDS